MPATAEMKEAEDRLRRFLRAAGASRAGDIVVAMEAHGYKESEARRALWRMIDSYEVRLTWDRKLELST